jgi:hypothetical protein
MAAPTTTVDTPTAVATTTDDHIVEVWKLNLSDFRRRLVVHFSIALEKMSFIGRNGLF